MTPDGPLVLITETWMTDRIPFWSFISITTLAFILVAASSAVLIAMWRPEKDGNDKGEGRNDRIVRRSWKYGSATVAAAVALLYVFVGLPATLQKQPQEHTGQYVLVDAPLTSAEIVDEQGFLNSRQIGVWVEGTDYALMLVGDEGLAFLKQEEGSPVTLYCDPEPQGTSLECSTTSSVDERRMGTSGVYNYEVIREAFSG